MVRTVSGGHRLPQSAARDFLPVWSGEYTSAVTGKDAVNVWRWSVAWSRPSRKMFSVRPRKKPLHRGARVRDGHPRYGPCR